MLNVKIPLHAIEETVVRPIVISVTEDIKKMLGLATNIYMQISEDDNIRKQVNKLGELRGFNNSKDQQIYLTWEEESEPEFELNTIPVNPEYKPIWEDKELQSKCLTIYHPRKLNIKFKYSTMSKSGIQAVTNNLRLMTSNDAHTRLHDLEYFYNTGNFLTNLLLEINNLKNIRLPNNEKLILEEYINNTFDDRADLTYTPDADLNKAELVIREAQLECNGYITDDVYNIQPTFESDTNQWSIEFNYSLSYDKPIFLNIRYPILVYNSLINKRFRVTTKLRNKAPNAKRTRRMDGIKNALNSNDILKPLYNGEYLTIPKSDIVNLPPSMEIFTRLFSVLCVLNPNDLTELFNIDDLPGLRFKPEIKEFLLTSEYPYVNDFLNSMFYLELYENEDKKVSNVKITLDKNGNLKTNKELDIKKIYRVVFNIVNDLSMLDFKAKARIKSYIKNEIEDNIVDGILTSDTMNIIYYKIFNVNTDLVDPYDITKYAKDDINYNFIESKDKAIMRTKAIHSLIAVREVLDYK